MAALGALTGCGPGNAGEAHLRIASGGPGGVYSRLGEALAGLWESENPRLRIDVLYTHGSTANLELIRGGAADIGFTQADVVPPADRDRPLALARLHDDVLHLVVRDEDDVAEPADLRGRRVSLGTPTSGTRFIALRILELAGLRPGRDLTEVSLPLAQSVRRLAEGDLSAFFFSGGPPVDAIAELAKETPVRLINLGAFVPRLRRQHGEVYKPRTVPWSAYGSPATSIGVPNLLVTRPDLTKSQGYDLTRSMLERRDALAAVHPAAHQLNNMSAILTHPLDLHPGSAEYYRDSKP